MVGQRRSYPEASLLAGTLSAGSTEGAKVHGSGGRRGQCWLTCILF